MNTLGQMGTKKNKHQDKWVITANGHWGHIGIWDNWALRACGDWDKWAFGANEHFGANGYMGQMGIEGKWVLGQMGI